MLAIITPEDGTDELSLVEELFEFGLKRLHVRKPNMELGELVNYIKKLPKKYLDCCVSHQHLQASYDLGLARGHLNTKARNDGIETSSKICSTSAHNESELASLAKFEYVFFSPVFKSISKNNYSPRYSLEEIKRIVSETKANLCALGGVTLDNIAKVRELGFSSAALCGGIWSSTDPLKTWKRVEASWQQ